MVPFAELGKAYLESHGKAAQPEDLPIEKLRSDFCVHGVLGAFDVAYPVAYLSEKDRVEGLKKVCASLLDLQGHWIDWLAPDPARVETAKADLAELKGWVKGWKQPALARAGEEQDKDLFKVLSASEAQVKAGQGLTAAVCQPDVLGVAPKDAKPVRILFSPTRHDFVELLGYGGLVEAEKQAELWQPAATEWTSFWIGWDFVMAMEYPPWVADPQFKTALPMDKFDKTGLEQHTVQQAANTLQRVCYGDDGAPHLHQAVAMNLAIAVCGELNALEGDAFAYGTSGGATAAYEKFVPGGNSSGGMLPPMPAASQDTLKKGRWREDLGKEHFVPALRKGQKNGQKQVGKHKPDHLGAKHAEDKNAHFLLVGANETTKYVVSAPFFGEEAKAKPYPPQEVILDYREFFRAYKSAFFHWLQTMGDPKGAAESAARFGELMRKVYEKDPTAPFEPLVREVYGLELSGKDGETDNLEWRFLEWLAKGQ